MKRVGLILLLLIVVGSPHFHQEAQADTSDELLAVWIGEDRVADDV